MCASKSNNGLDYVACEQHAKHLAYLCISHCSGSLLFLMESSGFDYPLCPHSVYACGKRSHFVPLPTRSRSTPRQPGMVAQGPAAVAFVTASKALGNNVWAPASNVAFWWQRPQSQFTPMPCHMSRLTAAGLVGMHEVCSQSTDGILHLHEGAYPGGRRMLLLLHCKNIRELSGWLGIVWNGCVTKCNIV